MESRAGNHLTLSDLPLETLVHVARSLPTTSLLNLAHTARAFRRILANQEVWTRIDLSAFGGRVTDASFARFSRMVAQWIAVSLDNNTVDAATGILEGNIHELILDRTAVSTWAAMRALLYPSLRRLSLRLCRDVSLGEVVNIISGVSGVMSAGERSSLTFMDLTGTLESFDSHVQVVKTFGRVSRDVFNPHIEVRPEACRVCGSRVCLDDSYAKQPMNSPVPSPRCLVCIAKSTCVVCGALYSPEASVDSGTSFLLVAKCPGWRQGAAYASCQRETRFCRTCSMASWILCSHDCHVGQCAHCQGRWVAGVNHTNLKRCGVCSTVSCVNHVSQCQCCKTIYHCWKCSAKDASTSEFVTVSRLNGEGPKETSCPRR